eukprot:g8862.t1
MGTAQSSTWAPFSRVADPESQRQNRPPHEFPNGAIYEGQWVGPAREGYGVQTWPDGACYDGQWVKEAKELRRCVEFLCPTTQIPTNDPRFSSKSSSIIFHILQDKAQGMGKFQHAAGDWYEGQYLDDMQHGYGVAMYVDGSKYTGQFWCDKHHGDGVEVWPDGKRFQGTYYQGMKHGQGTFRWPDGSCYEGNFEANNLSGSGTYTWGDGRSYTGEWERNTMHGKGTFSYGDGRQYTGDFFEDVKHGQGVFTWPDGRKYDGEWKNGQRHGKGRCTMSNHRSKNAYFEDHRCDANALRRAWAETTRPEVKLWLEQKIGLATFDRSYYYTVDTKQKMFYSAVTAEAEAKRLAEAGFQTVRVQICNIINFFDIQTKPKAARINAAVIRLLERGDVWRAQLLLSRGVAIAFKKPLSSLRTGSCIFDHSSEHQLYGQVGRRPPALLLDAPRIAFGTGNTPEPLRLDVLRRRPKLVTAVIAGLARRSVDTGSVLRVLGEGTVEVNIFHHNAALSSLPWLQAVEQFQVLRRSSTGINRITLNTLEGRLPSTHWCGTVHASDAEGCWRAASDYAGRVQLGALGVAAHASAFGRYWCEALAALGRWAQVGVETSLQLAFSATISSCEKGTAWRRAMSLLSSPTGLERDLVCHSASCSALENSTRWRLALVAFWKLSQRGLAADNSFCSAVIGAQPSRTAWEHSTEVLRHLLAMKLRPTVITLNSAVLALARVAVWRRALEMRNCLRLGGLVNVTVCCCFVRSHAAQPAAMQAGKIVQGLSRHCGVLNGAHRSPISSIAIVACRFRPFSSRCEDGRDGSVWHQRALVALAGLGLGALAAKASSSPARAESRRNLCIAALEKDLGELKAIVNSLRSMSHVVGLKMTKIHESAVDSDEKSRKVSQAVVSKLEPLAEPGRGRHRRGDRDQSVGHRSVGGDFPHEEQIKNYVTHFEVELRKAISDVEQMDANGTTDLKLPGIEKRNEASAVASASLGSPGSSPTRSSPPEKLSFPLGEDMDQVEKSLANSDSFGLGIDDRNNSKRSKLSSSEKTEDSQVEVPVATVPAKSPAQFFLIDPSWTTKLVWDIYVMLVVLCDAMVLPFQLSFKNGMQLDAFDDFWFWLTTLTFSADIFASFDTALRDEEAEDVQDAVIVDRHVIAMTYLKLAR